MEQTPVANFPRGEEASLSRLLTELLAKRKQMTKSQQMAAAKELKRVKHVFDQAVEC